jgi:hypothetical protein
MTPVYLLLVTWLGASSASSYQVEFAKYEACDYARRALIEEEKRINSQPQSPKVVLSAVCVDQQKGP